LLAEEILHKYEMIAATTKRLVADEDVNISCSLSHSLE
jgi:hypothetical protein